MNTKVLSLLGVFALVGVIHAKNPVIDYRYVADPSLRQFSDGRFYLFGTHETTNFDPNRRDWGTVDHRIQSSDDLVHWKDHGVAISREDLKPLEKDYPRICRENFWAPDGAESADGKFHIFLSLARQIVVASGTSPTGPFRDPAVLHVVKDVENREICGPIDPCVFKDYNGQWWLLWQSTSLAVDKDGKVIERKDGKPKTAPGGYYLEKLKPDLRSVVMPYGTLDPTGKVTAKDAEAAGCRIKLDLRDEEGKPKGSWENPFMVLKDGKYYFTWKEKHNAMGYAWSDSLTGEFRSRGIFIQGNDEFPMSKNIHGNLFEVAGKWYVAYHYDTENDNAWKRTTCIDYVYFNPDGTIQPVNLTKEGVKPVRCPLRLRCEYQDRPIAIEAIRPRLCWIVQDTRAGARQTAYRLLAASRVEKLQEGQADLWDSGKVESDQSVNVAYAGKAPASGQRIWWTVKVWDADGEPSDYAPATFWEMGVLKPADWQAELIRMKTEPEFSNDAVEHWMLYGIGNKVSASARAWVEKRMRPAPYFRREFTLDAVPARAKLLIASLGYYELYINGKRVGDRVLDPAYQEYDRQIYYVAHDVTGYLKQGRNAIGIVVGNGWYNQLGQFWGTPMERFYSYKDELGNPGVVVRLDAGSVRVVSDGSWKASFGPLLRNELFIGEVYDARREMPGWDQPGFDDSGWSPVEAIAAPAERLVAMQIAPERAAREVRAVQITEPSPGIYVVDLGETIAGWPKLTVDEPAGTKIAVRPAPFIRNKPQFMGHPLPYPDPKLDRKPAENMIGGELYSRPPDADDKERCRFHACDVYVAGGKGRETFQRRFSYVGFRYFEITGLTKKPALEDVCGVVVHTDLPQTGRFACSDGKVNELYESFSKTLRYVTHGLVNDNTDAEKNSFRGHQAMAGDFLAYAWNDPQLWEKAVTDIQLQTVRDGPTAGFPPIKAPAPKYFHGRNSGALVALADTLIEPARGLLFTGNRDLARRHFDHAIRFIELYADRMADPRSLEKFDKQKDKVGIIPQGDWLDVWKNGERPHFGDGASSRSDIVYRCLFVIALDQVIAMARVLGGNEEAAELGALRERVAATVNKLAYDSGKKSYGSQAENVLALQAGIVPAIDVPAVAGDLRRQIMVDWGGHLSVGFIGVRFISSVLSEFGHPDVAHHLWNVSTWPSWRWLYENGYDTANSYWNDFHVPGKLPAARFIQSEKPVAAVWCYESICGIKPVFDKPGFKHFILAPQPPPDMKWAEAEVRTVHGTIKSRWERDGGAVGYTFTVPANTTATIRLPACGGRTVSREVAAGTHTIKP